LKRENIITKIRVFKSFPERALNIESGIEKVSLEGNEYGKEIFLVLKSLEIRNENEFYTDLNGLHPKKRLMKPYIETDYSDYVNNFYPVTSFVYIEDVNTDIRMT